METNNEEIKRFCRLYYRLFRDFDALESLLDDIDKEMKRYDIGTDDWEYLARFWDELSEYIEDLSELPDIPEFNMGQIQNELTGGYYE